MRPSLNLFLRLLDVVYARIKWKESAWKGLKRLFRDIRICGFKDFWSDNVNKWDWCNGASILWHIMKSEF